MEKGRVVAAELAAKKKAEFEKEEIKRKESESKEKAEFEKNIEQHYQSIVSYYKKDSLSEARYEIALFEKYNKSDYKGIPNFSRKLAIMDLEQKVAGIPASDAKANLRLYEKLAELNPESERYKSKVAHYKSKVAYYEKEAEQKRLRAECDLELLNWSWGSNYGYAIAEGQIKNISGRKLDRVEALVTYYDNKRNMISSDSSLIEYRPLLPDQTSPFKVMTSYNPAMQKANIEFKFMFGGRIPTFHRKK